MTLGEALRFGATTLHTSSPSAVRDSEILLRYALKQSQHFCIAHPEYLLSSIEELAYKQLLHERSSGKPIAYITHTKEFYGRDFYVNEYVLIPREETEGLVDRVKKIHTGESRILDLCTGSGCIAITLKKELPHANITATDISAEAILVAQKNAVAQNADIQFCVGDLFDALPQGTEAFDIIVSNPPYVPLQQYTEDIPETQGLKFEPIQALVPHSTSTTGVEIIERILISAPRYLAPHGSLVMEIADVHGESVSLLAKKYFPGSTITVEQDLFGKDRYLLLSHKK